MPEQETLSKLLWKFSKEVIDVVKGLRESGKIHKVKQVYFTTKIEKFEYDKGIKGYSASSDHIVKEEWNWINVLITLEDSIKKLPSFKNVAKSMSEIYAKSQPQTEFWLSRFCAVLARRFLEGLTDETVVDLITTFINDIEGSPKTWNPIVWLQGIWLGIDKIQPIDGIVFRRPTPKDLEFEYPAYIVSPIAGEPLFPRASPSTILEIKHRARNQPEMQEELGKLIVTLRLYKVGSVENIRTEWHSKTILGFGGTSFRSAPMAAVYKYGLNSTDTEPLKNFIETIKPLIPLEAIRGSTQSVDYTVIAIQRYQDSIIKPETAEGRLTKAIMCLEALYLKPMETGELSHRLSQRVARTLSLLGFQPLEVYNIIGRAYGIRSKFVHGSQIEKEERQNVANLADKIIDYARISILIQLQLSAGDVDKEKFLALVDNSLLGENALTKLKKLVKDKCTVT